MLFGDLPGRLATETAPLQRLRASVGWGPFEASARARVTTWLTQRATDALLPSDLVARTEAILRSWQSVLPALSTLEELVASVTARAQDEVYTRIATGLSAELQRAMDDLLALPSGERRSALFHLKEYPPEASNAVIVQYIERYHFLRDFGVGRIDLSMVHPPMVRYLADLAKRYNVYELRRFTPVKRYALVGCFLVEIHQTMLDHIVTLHDQLMTKKMREAKNAFEKQYRQLRRPSRRGLAKLIATGQTWLDPARPSETTLATLLHDLDAADLRAAITICEERHRLEARGEIDAFRARYPGLRRDFPALFTLPFQGEPGSEALITGLDIVRQLDTEPGKTVQPTPPRRSSLVSFVRRCSRPMGRWIAAPGSWAWPSPCAMAYVRGMCICLRVAAMCPLRIWSTIPPGGTTSGRRPLPHAPIAPAP